jgi:hypothetical protein
MSIVEKRVRGRAYLYFQYYRQAKRYEEYLGSADDPIVWREARQKYKATLDAQLKVLDDRIAERFGLSNRRRLPDSVKPVADEHRRLAKALAPQVREPGLAEMPVSLTIRSRAVRLPSKKKRNKGEKR